MAIIGPAGAASSLAEVVACGQVGPTLIVAAAVRCNVSKVDHQASVRLPAQAHCFLL